MTHSKHHKSHSREHGPSLLSRKGLLAIVKVGSVEIGRHHFDVEAVSCLYFDDDQWAHLTVDVTKPLSYSMPKVGGTRRSHFNYKAVSSLHFDDDQQLHWTSDAPHTLSFSVPKGVEGNYVVEMWTGDEWALLETIPSHRDAKPGDEVRVKGPLQFAINPLKATLLLRTRKD